MNAAKFCAEEREREGRGWRESKRERETAVYGGCQSLLGRHAGEA